MKRNGLSPINFFVLSNNAIAVEDWWNCSFYFYSSPPVTAILDQPGGGGTHAIQQDACSTARLRQGTPTQ